MRVAKISAAVAMAFSAGAYAAPTITVTAPTSGKTVSGTILGPCNCAATGSGAARVDFYIDSTKVFTDGTPSNGITCYADTTKFANGAHLFKAVAVDSSGASISSQVSFNINNGGLTNADGNLSNGLGCWIDTTK